MKISFDTNDSNDAKILPEILRVLASFPGNPQPAVGNTGSAVAVREQAADSAEASASTPSEADAPVKRGRGRPRKEVAPETVEPEQNAVEQEETAPEAEIPAVEPEISAVEHEEPPAKAYTIDDVRAALQGFTAQHGMASGIDLLKNFGASRVSELKVGDYAAFIAGCGA